MTDFRILIDTDIGDDIDDAFALTLAANAGLDIAGVTTVFRNSYQRAQMATYLLRLCGRAEIPVRAGADLPLVQRVEFLRPPEIYQKEEEKGYYTLPQYLPEMENERVSPEHGVDFIIRTARENAGRLVVLLIGPMTNLALAIRKAPDLVRSIREVQFIGGNFSTEFPEWNIACDPEAARIVLTSGIPVRAIGIDVTMRCPLSDEQLGILRSDRQGTNSLLCQMMEKWFLHYRFERPVMHDPLLVAQLLASGMVTFEKKRVFVGLEGQKRQKVYLEEEPSLLNSEILVATDVCPQIFFEVFNRYIFQRVEPEKRIGGKR